LRRRTEVRSFVLNSASVTDLAVDRRMLSQWLRDAAKGMNQLTEAGVVGRELLMRSNIHQVRCLPQWSLFDVATDLGRIGALEEYAFVLSLADRARWTQDIAPAAHDRFLYCQQQELPGSEGEPLMLCVVIGGVTVGFPSKEIWDRDQVEIQFEEMLPSGTIEQRTENIDNLTRAAHARAIAERHRSKLRSSADATELWRRRKEVFPSLVFGPGVEANLAELGGHLSGVKEKLCSLDTTAEVWKDTGGDAPSWKTKVTREAASTRNDPKLMAARHFDSVHGGRAIFEWHARYGGGGRIHLRFDARTREIEVGYIGRHRR